MSESATSSRTSIGRRVIRILIAIVVVVAVLVAAFLVYAHIVMSGTRSAAVRVWKDERVGVSDAGNSIVMKPTTQSNGVGIVFVPGAKVDPYAYMETFRRVVDAGTTVVITKPTLNLAILDTRPLSDFETHAPGITTWAVAGHSLGGTRACALAPTAGTKGLLLLGSYCVNDLSSSSVSVLSLGGTRDGLSTPAKIRAHRGELPASARMVEIEGANHARFGHYGVQPGDGVATTSRETVDRRIAAEVDRWVAGLR